MRCAIFFTVLLGCVLLVGCASDKCTEVSKETPACAECGQLTADGATGWCSQCGTGFHEGKEVMCKGGCQANPGGPPCAGCVKQ